MKCKSSLCGSEKKFYHFVRNDKGCCCEKISEYRQNRIGKGKLDSTSIK